MSSETDATAKRRAALENLRFKKVQKSSANAQRPSPSLASLASSSSSSSLIATPAQSRDATMSSRYFTPPPPSNGTILVPNSSPIAPETYHRTYSVSHPPDSHDVADIPGLVHPTSSVQTKPHFAHDPLSAPSGFVLSGRSANASFSRQSTGIVRPHSDMENTRGFEPPRKRHRGPPSDPIDLFGVPDSPELKRAGQRQPPANGMFTQHRVANLSISSDDSIVDSGAGSSSSRIVHGAPPLDRERRSADTLQTQASLPNAGRFPVFCLQFVEFEGAKVRAAWIQARGDEKAAAVLLSDPTFTWNSSAHTSHGDGAASPATGRVKELDDAAKVKRAEAKEKGKRSMIYAARAELNSSKATAAPPSTPSPQKSSSRPESPPSPASPAVAIRQGKRTRKLVASDDEDDSSRPDSDGEPGRFKRRVMKGNVEQSKPILVSPSSSKSVERRVLDYFNEAGSEGLQEVTGCNPDQANAIIGLRPFASVNDLIVKLGQGKKKAGPNGISPRMFDDTVEIFEGYGAVDDVLVKCEKIGAKLRALVAQWTGSTKGKEKERSSKPSRGSSVASVASGDDVWEDGALSLRSIVPVSIQQSKDFLAEQPNTLSGNVQLKEYQLLGLNWLRLMYTQGYSCILADEMGLGKTVQVISLFAHLKESGRKGPHLVVVPSSTLENWVREFDRFAPSISVQTYYGGKEERPHLRQSLLEALKSKKDSWEVLITTYNLASGNDRDRKFLKKIDWDTCVFDEGHILKNYQSQRYSNLIKNPARWKLLLTGTPLQNNLQELVSLMNFILPQILASSMEALRAVFKAKGDSKVTLLARDRVVRAKTMMTPFVLRRRKDQVLKDLPKKIERIEWCDMTPLQRKLYNDTLQRSRKTVFDIEIPEPEINGAAKKSKTMTRAKDKLYLENSSNVLMDLRKAASHPMLFRTRFTNRQLDSITKVLMKEPDVSKRYKMAAYLKEDLEMSSDMELQLRMQEYRSTSQFLQDAECYLQAGKVQILLKLIEQYRKAGRRMLVFSQFVLVLEILVAAFKHKGIKFLMLTGQTPVDQRQAMVDDFTEDESIPIFLLSTKAGGVGINLTAASVVIIFDQDFNPHNDKQAQDRAYRIGQKRDVDVVKLITRGSIEEDMLKLGQTKLALDQAVAGDNEEAGENVERQMKTSLMSMLRQQATEGKPEETEETLEDLEPLTDLED